MNQQQPAPTYVYNETQKNPISYMNSNTNSNEGSIDIINKIALLGQYIKTQSSQQNTEIQNIKINQKKIELQVNQLFELCNDISKLATEVKDKLSQYDIDEGDDEFQDGESEHEMGDCTDNPETEQHPTNISNDSVDDKQSEVNNNDSMTVSDINDSGNVITDSEPNSNDDETEEHVEVEEVKPKRKYNRKKK